MTQKFALTQKSDLASRPKKASLYLLSILLKLKAAAPNSTLTWSPTMPL